MAKRRSVKGIYLENGESNPLKLAELSGRSVQYIKSFLKKNNEKLEVINNSNTKNIDYVPAGSGNINHWQTDVMFLKDYKSFNKGHIGILTVLNTNTRQVHARAIKSTQSKEVCNKMNEIIDAMPHPDQ